MKKKYIPNRYICYLYFLIPFIVNVFISYSSNEDIWYVMKYGKSILENGFMHIDFLSIHPNLHIVIQQSFSNILFYEIYHFLGSYGFFLLCVIMIALYLFLLYKICMMLSHKNILLSILLSIITVVLLEFSYITPRPQLFTYFHLLLILYIMEDYHFNSSKMIYFLPVISLLQINLHAALWPSIFLFILPTVAEMILKKDKRVWKILGMMVLMFLVGFINPYTYENVFFSIITYDSRINSVITELMPLSLVSPEKSVVIYSIAFYGILAFILLIYMYYKKGKLELRHLFLLGGTTILALTNVRSIAFFLLGSIYPLASYLKDIKWKVRDEFVDTKWYFLVIGVFILVLGAFHPNRLTSSVYQGGEYLKTHYDKDIVLYTPFGYGSYVEYLGYHSYMDTRAEVFLKKANHQEDIFIEAMNMEKTCMNYREFIQKYQFDVMMVGKNSCFYYYLKQDHQKIVFEDHDYVIFEIGELNV